MTKTPNPIQNSSQILKCDDGLRPYQKEAKRNIYKAWDEVQSVMFQMPTGTGKTVLFASIIRELDRFHVLRGARPIRVLVVAHRDELIEQASNHLNKNGIEHGIIKGPSRKNYYKNVQVGSINTVTFPSREKEIRDLYFDYIIIDEAHRSNAPSYRKLWDYYPDAKFLGVTATPCRLDGEGLNKLYQRLIVSPSIKEFISNSYLSKYKYYSIKATAEEAVALKSIKKFDFGDYDPSELERKFDTGCIRARLYDAYEKHAFGKKGIIYAIKRNHAKHICEDFQKHGISAVCIDSKTKDSLRKDLVRKFREGEVQVLVNVDIFSEGFDCPDVEFIQLARPTQSLTKYLQQVGRGLRVTKQKTECVILDNVGMYERFGFPDADRDWNKLFEGREKSVRVLTEGETEREYRERNTNEGNEEMVLLQGEDNTIGPDLIIPVLNSENVKEYASAIGYMPSNGLFYVNDKLYDYALTPEFTVMITEIDVNINHIKSWYQKRCIDDYQEALEEEIDKDAAYEKAFYFGYSSIVMMDYWRRADAVKVVGWIKPTSPLFSDLLQHKVRFEYIDYFGGEQCAIGVKSNNGTIIYDFGGNQVTSHSSILATKSTITSEIRMWTGNTFSLCNIKFRNTGLGIIVMHRLSDKNFYLCYANSDLGRLLTTNHLLYFANITPDQFLIYDKVHKKLKAFTIEGISLSHEYQKRQNFENELYEHALKKINKAKDKQRVIASPDDAELSSYYTESSLASLLEYIEFTKKTTEVITDDEEETLDDIDEVLEAESERQSFKLPDIADVGFSQFLRIVEYPIQEVIFESNGRYFDYIILPNFNILLFEVILDNDVLEEGYAESYETNWRSPFYHYWEEDVVFTVIAEIAPSSPLYNYFICHDIHLEIKLFGNNLCAIVNHKDENNLEYYNILGQYCSYPSDPDFCSNFFNVAPALKAIQPSREYGAAFSTATEYYKLGVWLVKTADDYIAVIKDSDLGQRLTYIKEQSESFYLKSVENQLWYFDHVSGFAKFYKNGILLEDADQLGASNVADEIKKIEDVFLHRIINSNHSKTRSQLQKILPYLDKDSFPRYSEFERFSHQD